MSDAMRMTGRDLVTKANVTEAGGIPVDWKRVALMVLNHGEQLQALATTQLEELNKELAKLEAECVAAGLRETGDD